MRTPESFDMGQNVHFRTYFCKMELVGSGRAQFLDTVAARFDADVDETR